MSRISIPLTFIAALLIAGCSGKGKSVLLVNQAEFDAVTDKILPSPQFERRGGGVAGGRDEIEFSATYEPKDPNATVVFDFAEWNTVLEARERFGSRGEGGSQGLYWRQTWGNKDRFIVIDAVAMKNGNIRVTYREVVR